MWKRFFVYSLSALLILWGITLLVSKSDNFLSQPLQWYTCPSASNYQNLKSSVADSLCDKLKAKYATDTAEKPWLSLIEWTFEKREAKKFREGMKVSSAMFAYMKDGIRLVIDLKNKPVDEEWDTLKEIDEIGNTNTGSWNTNTGSWNTGTSGSGISTPACTLICTWNKILNATACKCEVNTAETSDYQDKDVFMVTPEDWQHFEEDYSHHSGTDPFITPEVDISTALKNDVSEYFTYAYTNGIEVLGEKGWNLNTYIWGNEQVKVGKNTATPCVRYIKKWLDKNNSANRKKICGKDIIFYVDELPALTLAAGDIIIDSPKTWEKSTGYVTIKSHINERLLKYMKMTNIAYWTFQPTFTVNGIDIPGIVDYKWVINVDISKGLQNGENTIIPKLKYAKTGKEIQGDSIQIIIGSNEAKYSVTTNPKIDTGDSMSLISKPITVTVKVTQKPIYGVRCVRVKSAAYDAGKYGTVAFGEDIVATTVGNDTYTVTLADQSKYSDWSNEAWIQIQSKTSENDTTSCQPYSNNWWASNFKWLAYRGTLGCIAAFSNKTVTLEKWDWIPMHEWINPSCSQSTISCVETTVDGVKQETLTYYDKSKNWLYGDCQTNEDLSCNLPKAENGLGGVEKTIKNGEMYSYFWIDGITVTGGEWCTKHQAKCVDGAWKDLTGGVLNGPAYPWVWFKKCISKATVVNSGTDDCDRDTTNFWWGSTSYYNRSTRIVDNAKFLSDHCKTSNETCLDRSSWGAEKYTCNIIQ